MISAICYNPHNDYMPGDWFERGQDEDDWKEYFSLPVLAIVTVKSELHITCEQRIPIQIAKNMYIISVRSNHLTMLLGLPHVA